MNELAFALPEDHEAHEPPEARGIERDAVKLLVARGAEGTVAHVRFRELPEVLSAGDLLVINVSATLPAAADARRSDGTPVRVHFSTPAPGLDSSWRVVEIRGADGSAPLAARSGEQLALAGGASLQLVAPYASGARLMLARFDGAGDVEAFLLHHGVPIRYAHARRSWPLSAYQNVYATTPGSAEMPSAGRPFTASLLTRLVAAGVLVAPITLHAGVSSPEAHEPPFPEPYAVPAQTARLVEGVRRWGGRVIAVGTTVVRALETVARPDGSVREGAGWTGLVIGPYRGVRVIDGLVTGWHEPQASHLQMLAAIAGNELLELSYRGALEHGYLWHEFGDSHLILP